MKKAYFHSISLLIFFCFSHIEAHSFFEKIKNGVSQTAGTITSAGQKSIEYMKEKGGQVVQQITGQSIPTSLSQRDPNGCNGFLGLCSRRYNEVAYVQAHNATTRGPSVVNNQDISLSSLLSRGGRSIKLPIHWARDMGNQKGEGPTVAHGIYRPTLYKN